MLDPQVGQVPPHHSGSGIVGEGATDAPARQAAEALALGPAWVDSGLVFTSTVGTVIEDGQADAADVCAGPIADLCTENGVPQ